jgi:hypothetical protein
VNAVEIIEQVRRHDARLVVRNDRLVLQGNPDRLPDVLRKELSDHKETRRRSRYFTIKLSSQTDGAERGCTSTHRARRS